MNQEKIGKFIMECRKNKGMTQSVLAERLGVSDRTIGNWENGRKMPDLSLFKPICEELDISINELISGEKINDDKYQKKLEENLIYTIDYSNKKIKSSNSLMSIVLIVVGILLAFTSMTIFPSDSSWGVKFLVIGGIISLIGVNRLINHIPFIKRLLICFCYFILFLLVLFVIDYVSVISLKQMPRFCYIKRYTDNVLECENIFYNAYIVNRDTINEYIIIDKDKEYNMDTIPNVPFNRNKSGIDNIIKYKNKYIGDNSNTSGLINSLPLSEYGYVFEIDSENKGLIIDYHITDWYINNDNYLEKSIVYNSVSIFALIENVNYIKYNFSGKQYVVKRDMIENNYPYYDTVVMNGVDKVLFNKYVEGKINDTNFINEIFKDTIQ